jgi:hypothetical protein
VTVTAPPPPPYCPVLSDFTSNLNEIPMTEVGSGYYSTGTITYNGSQPISTTLEWHASDGNSRYPIYPNYNTKSLTLNPGGTFSLSVSAVSGRTVKAYGDQFTCS